MHVHAEAVGARDILMDRSEAFHVEALLALGDVDGARDALARLERRGRVLPRPWIDMALPRARALVLAGQGDVTGGVALLDDADLDPAAAPFEVACTLLVKGRLSRRAKQKRAAAQALTEALDSLRAARCAGVDRTDEGRARPRRPPPPRAW